MVASELTQAAKSELASSGGGSGLTSLGEQQQQQQQNASGPASGATALRNRAAQSISPYVQSHADSPVAWQLLDDQTLEQARRENKLIFLNVGFKACHCEHPPHAPSATCPRQPVY